MEQHATARRETERKKMTLFGGPPALFWGGSPPTTFQRCARGAAVVGCEREELLQYIIGGRRQSSTRGRILLGISVNVTVIIAVWQYIVATVAIVVIVLPSAPILPGTRPTNEVNREGRPRLQ
jgi:hypothetical protein